MTRDEVIETALEVLDVGFDFPTDAWGPTDEPYATIAVEAEVLSKMTTTAANTAKGGTLDGEGAWLTYKAKQDFGLDRKPAIATRGSITLTDSSAAPQTFAANALLFTSTDDADVLYSNSEPITVPASSTLVCTINAAQTGAKYNKQGSQLTFATPSPGLALTAAAGFAWITTTGADEESDPSMRLRCEGRWAELTSNGPSDSYVKWALDSSSEINRVSVIEDATAVAPDPSVIVTLAGPTGPVTSGASTAANLYIQLRRPWGTVVAVNNSGSWSAAVRGTVKIKSAYGVAAYNKIVTQLSSWFAGNAIKLRDTDAVTLIGLGIGEAVKVSQLTEVIMSVDGVDDVTLTDGSGVALGTGAVLPPGIPTSDAVAILTPITTSLLVPVYV